MGFIQPNSSKVITLKPYNSLWKTSWE